MNGAMIAWSALPKMWLPQTLLDGYVPGCWSVFNLNTNLLPLLTVHCCACSLLYIERLFGFTYQIYFAHQHADVHLVTTDSIYWHHCVLSITSSIDSKQKLLATMNVTFNSISQYFHNFCKLTAVAALAVIDSESATERILQNVQFVPVSYTHLTLPTILRV